MSVAEKEWKASGSARTTSAAFSEAITYLTRKLRADFNATVYERAMLPDPSATKAAWHIRIRDKVVEAYRLMPLLTMPIGLGDRKRLPLLPDAGLGQRKPEATGDSSAAVAAALARRRIDEPCRDFAAGRCGRGAGCKFVHVQTPKP
jgi:hypothetical protein